METSGMADMDEAAYGGLAPEVLEIGRRRAVEDRDLLARLLLEGKVGRDRVPRPDGPASRAFVRDIEARAEALRKPKVNLALRPKKRKR